MLALLQYRLGRLASIMERVLHVFNWADPRLTSVALALLGVVTSCVSLLFYMVPIHIIIWCSVIICMYPGMVRCRRRLREGWSYEEEQRQVAEEQRRAALLGTSRYHIIYPHPSTEQPSLNICVGALLGGQRPSTSLQVAAFRRRAQAGSGSWSVNGMGMDGINNGSLSSLVLEEEWAESSATDTDDDDDIFPPHQSSRHVHMGGASTTPPPAATHVTSPYTYFGPQTRIFTTIGSLSYWRAVITAWCTNVITRIPDALELTHRRTAAMAVSVEDLPPRQSLLIQQ